MTSPERQAFEGIQLQQWREEQSFEAKISAAVMERDHAKRTILALGEFLERELFFMTMTRISFVIFINWFVISNTSFVSEITSFVMAITPYFPL